MKFDLEKIGKKEQPLTGTRIEIEELTSRLPTERVCSERADDLLRKLARLIIEHEARRYK